jgi:2,3-bisphosphoglycerate-independent phosphoglycerate mutase
LSALGIDFELTEDDVAARGNFATLTSEGKVADRRAGRISTEKNKELVAILNEVSLPDVQVLVRTVKEHRFLLVLRGKGLDGRISDTDPQELGVEPLPAQAKHPEANESAKLVQRFMEKAQEALADQQPANGVLLRGFSKLPDWPNFPQVTGLRALAIAGYPMYRGVAKLIGMEAAPSAPGLKGVLETAEARWEDADFFFLHTKHVDSRGEDGNFAAKVAEIEEADHAIPRIRALQPDVLIVTGDHSTPAVLKYHSWHPVPVLLWSKHVRQDSVQRFGEQACLAGSLGSRLPATDLLPIALANALRLKKFGA